MALLAEISLTMIFSGFSPPVLTWNEVESMNYFCKRDSQMNGIGDINLNFMDPFLTKIVRG